MQTGGAAVLHDNAIFIPNGSSLTEPVSPILLQIAGQEPSLAQERIQAPIIFLDPCQPATITPVETDVMTIIDVPEIVDISNAVAIPTASSIPQFVDSTPLNSVFKVPLRRLQTSEIKAKKRKKKSKFRFTEIKNKKLEDYSETEISQLSQSSQSENSTKATVTRFGRVTKPIADSLYIKKCNKKSSQDSSDDGNSTPKQKKREPPAIFRCQTCQKVYLGHKRLNNHFLMFPDHVRAAVKSKNQDPPIENSVSFAKRSVCSVQVQTDKEHIADYLEDKQQDSSFGSKANAPISVAQDVNVLERQEEILEIEKSQAPAPNFAALLEDATFMSPLRPPEDDICSLGASLGPNMKDASIDTEDFCAGVDLASELAGSPTPGAFLLNASNDSQNATFFPDLVSETDSNIANIVSSEDLISEENQGLEPSLRDLNNPTKKSDGLAPLEAEQPPPNSLIDLSTKFASFKENLRSRLLAEADNEISLSTSNTDVVNVNEGSSSITSKIVDAVGPTSSSKTLDLSKKSVWDFVLEQIKHYGMNQVCGEINDMAERLMKVAREKFIPIREEETERLESSAPLINVDTPFFSHLLDLPFGTYVFKEDAGVRRTIPPPPPSMIDLSLTGGTELDVEKFISPDIDDSLPHLTNIDFNDICNE